MKLPPPPKQWGESVARRRGRVSHIARCCNAHQMASGRVAGRRRREKEKEKGRTARGCACPRAVATPRRRGHTQSGGLQAALQFATRAGWLAGWLAGGVPTVKRRVTVAGLSRIPVLPNAAAAVPTECRERESSGHHVERREEKRRCCCTWGSTSTKPGSNNRT